MRRKSRHYAKFQTVWTRYPAMVESHLCNDVICITTYPERSSSSPPREPATIYMTPQEAQGFAAWLSEQAEHLTAKRARADARRLAKQRGDA